MSASMHSVAPEHLPFFITAPGETDVLLVASGICLAAFVFLFGILYLRLHHLPEHIAHTGAKVQFEIVAILSLIAMFTHNNYFWIAALLLAFIHIPDFVTPLNGMAQSLAKIARGWTRNRSTDLADSKLKPTITRQLAREADRIETKERLRITCNDGSEITAPLKPQVG